MVNLNEGGEVDGDNDEEGSIDELANNDGNNSEEESNKNTFADSSMELLTVLVN